MHVSRSIRKGSIAMQDGRENGTCTDANPNRTEAWQRFATAPSCLRGTAGSACACDRPRTPRALPVSVLGSEELAAYAAVRFLVSLETALKEPEQ